MLHRMDGVAEMAPGLGLHNVAQEPRCEAAVSGIWMQETSVFISPLTDGGVWRGALLWAIALYIPLSAPLAAFEASLAESSLPQLWRQIALVSSSLLLALVVGLITQLVASWALGPGWASSLGVVVLGWSLLLTLTNRDRN